MKKYSHDSWNHILELPDGPIRQKQMRLLNDMVKKNLYKFICRLLGKKNNKPWYMR